MLANLQNVPEAKATAKAQSILADRSLGVGD